MNQSNKLFLPALFAVGGSLATLPASALELGEVNVQSTLGQPLRASIAYALAPSEQISSYCVTLPQGLSSNGLPAVRDARISVAGGVISLTGNTPIREPLLSLRVNVSCPYTPKLTREYMLFVDPALPAETATTQTPPVAAPVEVTTPAVQPAVARTEARTQTRTERPASRRNTASKAPIDNGTRYRVQPGDTLSGIASRIENRPVGLWNAVEKIFDANPAAFIDNDMNRLKAGSVLTLPDFGLGAATVAVEPAIQQQRSQDTTLADVTASATSTLASTEQAIVDDTTILEPATASAATEMQPGDLILDAENPFVDIDVPVIEAVRTEPTAGIVDMDLEAPTTAASPNVPTASVAPVSIPDSEPVQKINWLLWMIGGGVGLLAALLLFGRRTRNYADPEPFEPEAEHPMRRASDSMTVEAVADPDYDLDDDSPTAENLALDADLVVGTGLQDGIEMDVHQDFGFAASTNLDLELPDDTQTDDSESDMTFAPTVEQLAIVENADESNADDYDMSVIVDATKVSAPEDASEYDLKAVKLDETGEDTALTEDYTLNQEVDYKILEQDYEDELTATQALNKEIEKAAAELALNMEGAENDDLTAELKLASVTEIDATAKMPADFEYVSNIDDTGVNSDMTNELIADEKTVEMPKSGNDDTVEMPSKTRKADKKAG